MAGEWCDAETLQRVLGCSKSAFYRRLKAGQVEAADVGRRRLYRLVVRPVSPAEESRSGPEVPQGSGSPSGQGEAAVPPSPAGEAVVPAREVLGLVERYERRLDEVTARASEAERRAAVAEAELAALRHQVAAQSSGSWLRRGIRAALGG